MREEEEHQSVENANVTHNRVRPGRERLKGKGGRSILEGGKNDDEEVNLRNGINPWWPI